MHIVFNRVRPRTKARVTTLVRRRCTTRVRAFLVSSGKKRDYLAALPVDATVREIETFALRCDERMTRRGVPADVRVRLVARVRDGVGSYLNGALSHEEARYSC